MTRPMRQQVDDAIAVFEGCDWVEPPEIASAYGKFLAAEVRALRADLAEARRNAELHNDAANAAELRIVELRATIERVEALPAKWLDYVAYDSGGVPDCAKDLEDALLRKPEGL